MKTLSAALLLIAVPLACQAENFDVKTGAWEITVSTTMAGMMMPKEAMANMPPAQRAKFEAMMQARAGKANTHTTHSCVTPEDLARGKLMAKEKERKNCTRKVISQAARHFEFEEVCAAPEASTTHAKFDAASAESYTATMDMTRNDGKVHVDMRGRWLGPTCKKGVDD
jgi:hypothetical protein